MRQQFPELKEKEERNEGKKKENEREWKRNNLGKEE
jgi:hypothetical protein